jgi:peptidoglycan/xylan/chitin deacetylase (PgdA/CDA1 family)
MLHRVGDRDPERIAANQNMVIFPEELDVFIANSKKSGWSFISLGELAEAIKNKKSLTKKLVITFDDGYLDNLTKAAPVLTAHDVPFTVYVTTGFVGSEEIPWWYKLEAILMSRQYLELPDSLVIESTTLAQQQVAFLKIRTFLMASGDFAKACHAWVQENYSEPAVESGKLFMNWDDLNKLAAQPLVTIGAHTHTHPVLSALGDCDSFQEMLISKDILEKKLKRPVCHLAYPFGGSSEAGEREFLQAETLGFETAVTTRVDSIDAMQINRYSLPRCFYGPGLTMDILQKQLFKNKLKKPVKRLLMRD